MSQGDILRTLEKAKKPMTATELSKSIGIGLANVNRALRVLCKANYIDYEIRIVANYHYREYFIVSERKRRQMKCLR
jgi:DNA-binding transcriptional regulator GbsR (MarR family)